MKFAFTLLPIAAALRFVVAGPVAAEDFTKRAPVPVTELFCDGDTYKCTATLLWGDGTWVAQWDASVFQTGMFGHLTKAPTFTTMAPVPVTDLKCDGDTYKCTAKLDFGDGNWVAQWPVAVFHQVLFHQEAVDAVMTPVPVHKLTCDGDTYQCTANLVWADGRWVAQWDAKIFQENLFRFLV